MGDYSVEYEALQQYGSTLAGVCSDAADTLAGVRVDGARRGMPGSMSSAAASALQGRWDGAVSRVSEHLSSHPAALIDAADAYETQERDNQGQVEAFFGVEQ